MQRPSGSIVVVDAAHITSLDDFFCALGDAVQGSGGYFGRSLLSLEDCLVGGFGMTPPWTLHVRGVGHLETTLDAASLASWARARIDGGEYLDDEGHAWLRATAEAADAGARTMWSELRVLFEAHGVTVTSE